MQILTLSLIVVSALTLALGACSPAPQPLPWLTDTGNMAYPSPAPQGNLTTTRVE